MHKKINIGIIGNGFVGKATQLLDNKDLNIIVYDNIKEKCIPNNIKFDDLKSCDIVFICVPTPANKDGSCSTKILDDIIPKLKNIGQNNIIIRSTIPPGFSDSYNCYFMPEFLREMHWEDDVKNTSKWILGVPINVTNVENDIVVTNIRKVLSSAKDNCKIMHTDMNVISNLEAEIIKLSRNCFLAVKVSFFNELYDYCSKIGANYNIIREFVSFDKRIGDSHTYVPGPDGERGFGGTCFPKDMMSMEYNMKGSGLEPIIISAANNRNKNFDRKNRDWEKNKGRAVV